MKNVIIFYLLITLISESHLIVVSEDDLSSGENNIIDIEIAPYALSLRLNDDHICGAAIINSEWGITAAHCVTTFIASASNYSVRSGSKYRKSGGSIHQLTEIIPHENFSQVDSDYDVAVFKIEPMFQFNALSRPVMLPSDETDNSWGAAVGWGAFNIRDENILSNILRIVALPKVDWNECVSDYISVFVVTPRQMCYGFKNGGRDTCKGDSGGPLVNKDNILIGITSWGDECARPNSPGIYTDVHLIKDWINLHIET
ncbi:trypsin-3-like isoform X1 [Microplitis mediator]|uniref:trypsin-3-like isoform X1 n=1 Tax=Microplitis mediator TaxID=375433 RepID=UPI002555BEE6|nr:trypsin-3-like isoform X1 [Microplitis mediator]